MIETLVKVLAVLSIVGIVAKWGYLRLHEMNQNNNT